VRRHGIRIESLLSTAISIVEFLAMVSVTLHIERISFLVDTISWIGNRLKHMNEKRIRAQAPGTPESSLHCRYCSYESLCFSRMRNLSFVILKFPRQTQNAIE
jgi:hypothetical protein